MPLALAFGLALLALPVVLADGRELLRTVRSVQPEMLRLPFGLALLSYAAMARSYQGIAEAAGCRLGFGEWFRITLVSSTVNYVVTSAGLSGFAARLYLLAQQGVPSNQAVVISLVQTFLTNVTLLVIVVVGFAVLVARHALPPMALAAAATAVVAFATLLVYAVVLVYHRRLRRRTLFFMADVSHRIGRRIVPHWTPGRVHFWRFHHHLNTGLEFVLARKERMRAPAAWILLDWVFTVGILWTAFRAVNHPLALGLVAVGFAVGICLSFLPLVPAGLGVMEGSMTAVFVALDVPLEPAILAALLFRLAYYGLPILVSVFVFRRVLRGTVGGAAAASKPFADLTFSGRGR